MSIIIFLLIATGGAYCLHLKVLKDIIDVVESVRCLHILGSPSIIDGLFHNAVFNYKPYIQNSFFLRYNDPSHISCYYKHVKISYGGDLKHLTRVMKEVEVYPFQAFSTIIILEDVEVVELEGVFSELIERYSVQIIVLSCVWDEEKVWVEGNKSVSLRLVNKNLYFYNWGDEGSYRENLKVIKEYQKVRFGEDIKNNVTVSVFNCTPFFYKNGGYDGVEYLMMKEIVPEGKLEFVFYENPLEEDFWSTVSNDVTTGRTDIGMCSQWLTVHKNKNKDFSKPYTQVCGTFLVPKPYPEPYSKYVLLPFGKYVWYLIISFTIITTITLHITSKIESYHPYTNFYYTLIQIIRILSQQSLKFLPPSKYWSIRLLILFWAICTLLLTTGYSAGYTSLLTSPRYTKPINTLNDFITANIHWGFRTKNFVDELSNSTDPTTQKISTLFQLEPNIHVKNQRIATRTYGTFIKKMKNAFVTDTEDLNAHSIQTLRAMHECLFNYNVVTILRKNLPLTDRINRKITTIIEGGFIKYWFTKINLKLKLNYMEMFFNNINEVDNKNKPLTLETCQGVFIFLFFGHVLATIVFTIEIVMNHFCKYYRPLPYVN